MSGYYGEVAAAFDRAAGSYQADYGANPIMAWLEDETFALLTDLFPPGSRLLEIGCGDGSMALRLAEAGRAVLATDISPAMIAQAAARAASSSARERLAFRAVAAGGLAALAQEHGGRPAFSGVYSNFGPLNCEPDLRPVAAALADLLPAGGALVCSVMNRWCAWEIAWGLLRLRPREGLRRLRRGWVSAHMSAGPGEPASTVPVRYFTPSEFAAAFAPAFRVEAALGFPVLIPPPYLARRFGGTVARLASSERRVRPWPLVRALGDHFLLVLRREQSDANPS